MANAARDTPVETRTAGAAAPVHALGNRLVIVALGTSPLMWLIELWAPQWAIYFFRASWVVLVAVAAVVVVRERRSIRRPNAAGPGTRADQEH